MANILSFCLVGFLELCHWLDSSRYISKMWKKITTLLSPAVPLEDALNYCHTLPNQTQTNEDYSSPSSPRLFTVKSSEQAENLNFTIKILVGLNFLCWLGLGGYILKLDGGYSSTFASYNAPLAISASMTWAFLTRRIISQNVAYPSVPLLTTSIACIMGGFFDLLKALLADNPRIFDRPSLVIFTIQVIQPGLILSFMMGLPFATLDHRSDKFNKVFGFVASGA